MSLAAAVPYVLAYEDQMQSAASSRVPAHAQIGQHQQNRGVSWVLACHGCWQASLSCQQRRWVIASSRVQCLPAPRDTFFVRDSKNVSLGAGMLACTGAGNCSKTGCDRLIGDRTGSSLVHGRGAARAPHSRAVGGGTPQTCPGSAPRRPADLRTEQGVT